MLAASSQKLMLFFVKFQVEKVYALSFYFNSVPQENALATTSPIRR